MFLIVGLGNPGKKYENTRHNIGFLVLDALAKQFGVSFEKKADLEAELARFPTEGPTDNAIFFLKPETFMNLSGKSIQAFLRYKEIPPQNIVVVYDDADLPFGTLRFRASGSSGGHNGMKSLIEHIGTDEIPRLKIGIGRAENELVPLDEWVLQPWKPEEKEQLPTLISNAVEHIKKTFPSH